MEHPLIYPVIALKLKQEKSSATILDDYQFKTDVKKTLEIN
jgi:hypothetical protein